MNYIIVTNSYQRPPELVERCLRASLKQKVEPLKVILIDQNETKLQISKDILENPLFERQKVNRISVSAARNSLIILNQAEWIFFCDDDGYPCDDYSERMNKIISDNKSLEILAGSIVRQDNNEYYSLRHKKGGSLKYFRYTKNLMGSNFVVRVKTFNELGRFDENFGVGSYWESSEETDFCWKAYFDGRKMEFFPELIVYHLPPFNENIKTGLRKAFLYGIGKGALVYKWLFKKKKLKVIFELLEMLAVPFIQSVRGLLTLKPQIIVTNMGAFYGRLYGFVKAFAVKK